MLETLITIAKVLIMFSFLIVGLYIVDLAETRLAYMNFQDVIICITGTVFIMFSFLLLMIFSKINK
jgi:hypothetical protein